MNYCYPQWGEKKRWSKKEQGGEQELSKDDRGPSTTSTTADIVSRIRSPAAKSAGIIPAVADKKGT